MKNTAKTFVLSLLSIVLWTGCGSNPASPSKASKQTTIRAVSCGTKGDTKQYGYGYAEFALNGSSFFRKEGGPGGGRGVNVAVVSKNGYVLTTQSFDTWDEPFKQLPALSSFINSRQDGEIIMLAIADEGGFNGFSSGGCGPMPYALPTVQLLEAQGSKQIRSLCYWGSWAIIFVKGEGVAKAEAMSPNQPVTVEYSIPK